MLYFVSWELVSWLGECPEVLMDLSDSERRELEDFFAKEKREGRLMSYRFDVAQVTDMNKMKKMYARDLEDERKTAEPDA